MLTRTLLLVSFFGLIETLVLNTPLGAIRGAPFQGSNGKKVYAFKRVPFAAPPVGDLRFALPQKPLAWKGVWDATEYGPACLSNSSETSSPQKWVDEDCLHLNIFTSQKCLKSSCPVIFYLHGGGFNYDSAVMFKDEYMVNNFAAKDFVMVIAGFRLGFTGLLSFANDNVVHRNMAVYDIIAGLEFLQEHISYFGGNPRQVTMLGHSGGGAAVLALSLSKTIDSELRLFQQGIAMSGPIAAVDELTMREITWEFAYRMGCTYVPRPGMVTDNFIREAVDCLRTKDQFELLRVQREMEDEKVAVPQGIILTGPLFEADFQSTLKNPPPRPMMMGSNTREMDTYSTVDYSVIISDLYGYKNPQKIGAQYKKDKDEGKLAFDHATETQLVYTGNQLCGDALTEVGAKVYIYSYQNPRHPDHTDDLSYLMGVHTFEMDKNEKELSVIYPELFLNFCRSGKPNEEWEAYSPERRNYYYVDVNLDTGLRPHNEDYYNKDVLDYWTKEAAELDKKFNAKRNFTKKLMKTRRGIEIKSVLANEAIDFPETNTEKVSTSSSFMTPFYIYYWYLSQFCILLFFSSAGYLLGRHHARTQPSERYIRIEEANEKTPLFM